ncbi:MAG: S41 family peptidase [Flavobacteriaceae bacterium]
MPIPISKIRKRLLLFFLTFFVINLTAQEVSLSTSKVLDSIISIAKSQSVYANKVDWPDVTKKMHALIKDGDSLPSIIPPVELMMKELGDFHGALLYNFQRHNSYYKQDYLYPVSFETVQAIQSLGIDLKGVMLPGQIAYVKIPGMNIFGPEEINKNANALRTIICDLKGQKPKGWIIDLRANLGGNMYPMFAGLGELLPNIDLSGDTQNGIDYFSNWENNHGNFYMWGAPMTQGELQCNPKEVNENTSNKIAVLTSRYTASSGEAVASGLKNHENIQLFGEITSGYSSTTGWFPITEHIVFSPTVAYFKSLDGTVYDHGVYPDVVIEEPLDLENLTSGITIEKAIEWLTSD